MRNIVLIAIDTQRADHLGCYGYHRATSPRLDGLAAAGVAFDACWSASNFTAPAFTSLFTGLYPNHHGVFDFAAQAQASPVYDCLRANGVRTGGAVTFRFFKRLLGRVWGDLEAVTDTRSGDYAKDLPRAVSDAAVEWLANHGRGGGPFALFLHYDGPHMPYRLPDEHVRRFGDVPDEAVDPEIRRVLFPQEVASFDDAAAATMFQVIEAVDRGRRRLDDATRRWLRDRYDDSVFYNDQEVGRVLDALQTLDLADDTLVCVISDHGEELLDHGHLAHAGIHLYEETVRTVALVRGPGLPAGRRVARPVSHVQLWPWLLRAAGARGLPAAWAERDLLDEDAAEPVFCIGEFKAAVRRGDRKLIRRRVIPQHGPAKRLRLLAKLALLREWGAEAYDLGRDPRERANVAGSAPWRGELEALLAAHLDAAAPDLGVSGKADLDAAERARIEKEMRDLGYM